MVKKYHENVLVYSTGFYINAKYPHLGASTGDMIICDCRGKGLLEIKCPHKYHNGLKVWKDVKIFHLMNQIKKDCVYHAQVQGQLLILDINFCESFIWKAWVNIIVANTLCVFITNWKSTAYATGHALSQYLPVIGLILK